jgi:hypothetical protein
MNYKEIIIKYIIVIALGFTIFYLDDQEVTSTRFNTGLVLVIAGVKLFTLFFQSYKKIMQVIEENVAFHRFLIYMTINIAVLITSFAVDFFCLYNIDPSNLFGMPQGLSYPELFFECIYFSMLGFNNLGFYDVVPNSYATKILVMLEIMSYFITIVFILSDFISLKESILGAKEEKEGKTEL